MLCVFRNITAHMKPEMPGNPLSTQRPTRRHSLLVDAGGGDTELPQHNPVTHTDWEGTGVIPDVEAAPADALKVAQALLQRHARVAALP